jgi:hypothetical protein
MAAMTTRLRGKWALGIAPRNLTWVIGDRLAICERPGGCGANHRRVRRQEEIIWLRENNFSCVVSVLAAPHNLHNYEEMGVQCLHRPVIGVEEINEPLVRLFTDLRELLRAGSRILVHADEVNDDLIGVVGSYIRWEGLVEDPVETIMIAERIGGRQLDPASRELIMRVHELR